MQRNAEGAGDEHEFKITDHFALSPNGAICLRLRKRIPNQTR